MKTISYTCILALLTPSFLFAEGETEAQTKAFADTIRLSNVKKVELMIAHNPFIVDQRYYWGQTYHSPISVAAEVLNTYAKAESSTDSSVIDNLNKSYMVMVALLEYGCIIRDGPVFQQIYALDSRNLTKNQCLVLCDLLEKNKYSGSTDDLRSVLQPAVNPVFTSRVFHYDDEVRDRVMLLLLKSGVEPFERINGNITADIYTMYWSYNGGGNGNWDLYEQRKREFNEKFPKTASALEPLLKKK